MNVRHRYVCFYLYCVIIRLSFFKTRSTHLHNHIYTKTSDDQGGLYPVNQTRAGKHMDLVLCVKTMSRVWNDGKTAVCVVCDLCTDNILRRLCSSEAGVSA